MRGRVRRVRWWGEREGEVVGGRGRVRWWGGEGG